MRQLPIFVRRVNRMTNFNFYNSTITIRLCPRSVTLTDLEHAVAPRTAAPQDRHVRRLAALPRPATFGELARRAHRMAATLGATFAATVRVVDRKSVV
jgi:hypothetical protein